jgi:outer membrane biosynthesis protein TonB
MMIELTGKGSDSHQAVGHLPDGTMVVVEHARSHIGQSVLIEVVRSLQTAAGKMMFAKLAEPDTVKSSEKKPRSSGRAPITRREKAVVKKADHQESEPTRAAEPEPKAKPSRTVYHASPRTQKRSQEQKPAQKSQQQSAEKEQPHAQKQHKSASNEHANAPKRQTRPQRNSRRRNDHEADLIALVNNQ